MINLTEYLEIEEKIVNKKLGDILVIPKDRNQNKGLIGQLIEVQLFNKKLDNKKVPDIDMFVDIVTNELKEYYNEYIKLELKSGGINLKKNGQYSSKERLVMSTINYNHYNKEIEYKFEDSEVYEKCKLMILIYYIYDKNLPLEEYRVIVSMIFNLEKKDLSILRKDYNIIINKIKDGKAHEISGSDTFFLEALRKGQGGEADNRTQPYSEKSAKSRAFALKASYMNTIINEYISKKDSSFIIDSENDDLDYINNSLNKYINKTVNEIMDIFGMDKSKKPKQINAMLVRNMLGVNTNKLDDIDFFKKANIKFKTVRVSKSKKVKETMNYTNIIDYDGIVSEEWEDSVLYEEINRKYFYCLFQESDNNEVYFRGYIFRGFNDEEIDEFRKLWEKVKNICIDSENIERDLPKSTDGFIGHIRPKGVNREKSLRTLKNGQVVPNKVFWVNKEFIQKELIDKVIK